MTKRATVLARLASVLSRMDDARPLAARLCQAGLEILEVDGAAITFSYATEERMTVWATDPVVRRIEDMQEVAGEGPGWDAYRNGVAVTGALGGDGNWPLLEQAFSRSASTNDVSARREGAGDVAERTRFDDVGRQPLLVYAIPMRAPAGPVGVLTLYGTDVDEPVDLDAAQFLADAVGAALMREPGWEDDDDPGGAWASRATIHQATGMVIAQLRLNAEDALALLRAHAYAHETSLFEIAANVVERRLDFTRVDKPMGDQ